MTAVAPYHQGTEGQLVPEARRHVIKQDLIQRVVDRGVPRVKAEQAVEAVFRSMKRALIEGDRIELRGFGVFSIRPRKTGIGRNPRTGREVSIEPGRAVRFKPGRELQALDGVASSSEMDEASS